MSEINGISQEFSSPGITIGSQQKRGTGSFKSMMLNNLNSTNDLINTADRLSEDFALGRDVDVHKVMIAMERAQVAMQYTIQIRNKLVEGFQELIRMQV